MSLHQQDYDHFETIATKVEDLQLFVNELIIGAQEDREELESELDTDLFGYTIPELFAADDYCWNYYEKFILPTDDEEVKLIYILGMEAFDNKLASIIAERYEKFKIIKSSKE